MSDIISIVTLLLGGGGIGFFFTWKYSKRKEKAEAASAEAVAAKELQDVYQQLINDIKTDRDEQKTYINELKSDRQHLRNERDELRKRQDNLEEMVRNLQREVARNGRQVEAMRPLLCGRVNCPDRVPTFPEEALDECPVKIKKQIKPKKDGKHTEDTKG